MIITDQQKIDSLKYAVTQVDNGKAYNRFNMSRDEQIERWYIGKLGEMVFFNLLAKNGIHIDYSGLFPHQADEYDFLMPNKSIKIDVKSCTPYDRYLLVPKEQMLKLAKIDIYVGVIVDEKNSKGFVDGYIWKEELIKNTDEVVSKRMPDGECYNARLVDLKSIDKILQYWYF
jgi:hypothetical protein